MNRFKILIAASLILLMAVPGRPIATDVYEKTKYCQLSVRKLKLEQEEKIAGFKLKLQGAYVYSVPVVPVDWSLNIVNNGHVDDRWLFVAIGHENHGAGAVSGDFFKNFAVIGVFKPTERMPDVPKFDLELEITIELDHIPRTVVLHPKDMVYTPYKADRAY